MRALVWTLAAALYFAVAVFFVPVIAGDSFLVELLVDFAIALGIFNVADSIADAI